jgi:hypothetical protein
VNRAQDAFPRRLSLLGILFFGNKQNSVTTGVLSAFSASSASSLFWCSSASVSATPGIISFCCLLLLYSMMCQGCLLLMMFIPPTTYLPRRFLFFGFFGF